MPPLPTPPGSSGHVPDWDALARHLAGESPAEESRAVAAWLAAHPADARLLGAVDLVATTGAEALRAEGGRAVDVEAALRQVQARRDAAPAPARSRPPVAPIASRGRATPGARRGWRRAAVAVAALAAAVLLLVAPPRWQPESGEERGPSLGAGLVDARRYSTAAGQRDSVRLPDGTRVVLGPESVLSVPRSYADGGRTVHLDGMAWFAVAHDPVVPFTVRAGRALIQDLGTEFVVRTDQGGGGATVLVTEGVVSLRSLGPSADSGLVLEAGDRGTLHDGSRLSIDRAVVTADDVAWTTGRLVYRAAPLAEVGADLRRWYGVELQVPDPALARRRVTTIIVETDPVDAVLRNLALALGAEVERRDSVAVLRPGAR